jgi:hypothetical protein
VFLLTRHIACVHGLQRCACLLQNPYCCERPAVSANGHTFMGALTQGLGADRFLVNGGYQPRISMQHRTWQRWRFLFSGSKVSRSAPISKCQCQQGHPTIASWSVVNRPRSPARCREQHPT